MELFIVERKSSPKAVTSWAGRTGPVEPLMGDYTPEMVGAESSTAAETKRQAHAADLYAHTHYLTRSIADGLYVAADSVLGESTGTTWFQLSGIPRIVQPGEEVFLAHHSVANAQALPIVWIRQPGAQDVTSLAIDFDLADAALYVAQNPTKTSLEGQVRLRQADPGAIWAVNFATSSSSVYGQVGQLQAGAVLQGDALLLGGAAFCLWDDFPGMGFGLSSFCMELTCIPTSLPGGRIGLLSQTDGGGYRAKWFFYLLDAGNGFACLGFHTNGPGFPTYDVITDPFPLALGQTHHFVLQRSERFIECFVDGVRRTFSGATSFLFGASTQWPDPAAPLLLGAAGDHIQASFQGSVIRARVRVGPALYVDGFTPPSLPFVSAQHDTHPAGWWVHTGPNLSLDLSMVETIDHISAAVIEPALTAVRFLISWDRGGSWVADTGQGFVSVSPANAIAQGMSAAQLLAASTALDVTAFATLDLLICVATSNPDVTPSVDAITIQYDEKASYSPALIGRYGANVEFGIKHWSRITSIKNQTSQAQTIIAYVVKQGGS